MSIVPAAAAAAGLYLLVCLALSYWARVPDSFSERIEATTDDGWTLSLYRYPPAPGSPPRPVPVLLGHGVHMNRRSWALSEDGSLPTALAARGHDVFVAEYRGTASSRPPEGVGRWDYGLMDHARSDLPALIEATCRASGSPHVSWVGHSMGGMLVYLHCALRGSSALHRVATLGSPVRFSSWGRLGDILLSCADWWLRLRPRAQVVGASFLGLPVLVFLRGLLLRLLLNPRHLGRRETARLCWSALENVSSGVVRPFVALNLRDQDLCPGVSEDREGLLKGGLDQLKAPLLVISGSLDGIAPPRAVEPAYHRAGSTEAAYVELGSDVDRSTEDPPFGHCDLISGRAALTRVLPILVEWLEEDAPSIDCATLSRSGQAPSPQAS